MSDALAVLLQFAGVTAIVLVGAVTFHVMRDMLGPEGVEGVRRMREKMFRD